MQLYFFFNIGTGWGGWSKPRPGRFTPGRDPVPIVQEAGWSPGPVWTVAENLAPPTGIRSPDRPARSESLYRMSYPGPCQVDILCELVWGDTHTHTHTHIYTHTYPPHTHTHTYPHAHARAHTHTHVARVLCTAPCPTRGIGYDSTANKPHPWRTVMLQLTHSAPTAYLTFINFDLGCTRGGDGQPTHDSLAQLGCNRHEIHVLFRL